MHPIVMLLIEKWVEKETLEGGDRKEPFGAGQERLAEGTIDSDVTRSGSRRQRHCRGKGSV